MKKILFVLVAMLTLVFTGCKIESSKVTVSVKDTVGAPVNNCPVIYADYATIVLDALVPSPEQLITNTEDCWEYASTNAQGTVTVDIILGVSSMKYRFGAYDSGKNDWVWKDVNLKRGVNDEVEIVVNK